MSRAGHSSAGRGRRLGGFSRWWLLAAAALILLASLPMPMGAAAQPSTQQNPIPVLAYYYIWYNPSSWNRAKTDLPLLGRYSSDEREVMRQHVRWAKEAGIQGFIVSWKSTPTLNDRLEKLMEVANEEGMKLAIIYQGLDFDREPLPPSRIAADLDSFISRYADDPAFDLFSKPLIIWSGTWEFSREEVASVTEARRDDLLLLASERNTKGYDRLSDLVDGDAYYWSSVNPVTYSGYPKKLQAMSDAVHAAGGLWIAPAAPGFDARLIGGTTVVERKDGKTLRREMDAAFRSSPDALGLISWNEFSENTHLEPSANYGTRYLEVIADVFGGVAPVVGDLDSSAPSSTGTNYGLPVLGGLAALVLGGLLVIVWRGATGPASDSPPRDPGDNSPRREALQASSGVTSAVRNPDAGAPTAESVTGGGRGLPVLGGLAALVFGGLVMVVWRGLSGRGRYR